MAVTKLSQIANASAPPAITDTVVGVGGGTTDLQYSFAQIQQTVGGLAPAGGNLTFYVATTGSDSNPGTIGSPFATIQHAFAVTATFDYQFLYKPTIHVAAGTYTLASELVPPELTNLIAEQGGTITGAGYATTTLFAPVAMNGIFFGTGPKCRWTIGGFTTDSQAEHYQITNLGNFVIGTIAVTDSSGNIGFATYFEAFGGAELSLFFSTVHILWGDPSYVINMGGSDSNLNCNVCTFVFPAGVSGSATTFLQDGGNGTGRATFFSAVFSSVGSWAGLPLAIQGSGGFVLGTDNGALSDLPGSGTPQFDMDLVLQNFGGVYGFCIDQPLSAPPSSTNITPFLWDVVKDTTNGPRMIAMNDGGVVYVLQIGRNINLQSGSYALQLFDQEGRVEVNDGSSNTLTVPTNSVPFPIGTEIRITQIGAGAVTIAGAGGVTVHNAGALVQWGSALLYKRGTNEWVQTTV